MTWQAEVQPEHHPLLILQMPSFAVQPVNNTTAVESRDLPRLICLNHIPFMWLRHKRGNIYAQHQKRKAVALEISSFCPVKDDLLLWV